MPAAERLLVLGGTGEAAALVRALHTRFGARFDIVSSLAGRAGRPDLPGRLRVGGFGGADGLAEHLRAQGYAAVIDATHPFAARISANARQACDAVGVPRLMLLRPPWAAQPGDRWIEATDATAAARLLPDLGRRAFLAVGAGETAAFAAVPGMWFLVRLLTAGPPPLPGATVVVGRGPFDPADELRLLAEHAIDVVVTKAAGGEATHGKIAAARTLGLPVLLLRRPPVEPGEAVVTVAEAVAWVEARIGGLVSAPRRP